MEHSSDRLRDLLRAVWNTPEEEAGCERFLTNVGAYLECREREGALSEELLAVKRHLAECPDCLEEFEALLRAEGGD